MPQQRYGRRMEGKLNGRGYGDELIEELRLLA